MSLGGTASYRRPGWRAATPELVVAAVERAERLGFELCVRPEIGRFLGVLAAGVPGGALVGETGTGTGAGLAWMVTAADPTVRFVSYERDADRAHTARDVFKDHGNVEVVRADAADLFDRGPFDLLVLDGGPGSGKTPGAVAVDPAAALLPGGTMTIDDYTPATTWPPTFDGEVDASRMHWLSHPDLRATEIRVASDVAVVVCRYLPDT